ncbi:MAG: hypothetical protein COB53_12690 [Elusimicrobia bacterium]|nr:MAG: hypothetical protein COB53_12690 [Elusimicrobiota bacterium]
MEPITTLFLSAWAAKSGAAIGWFKWRKKAKIRLRGRAYCSKGGKALDPGYFIGSILATNYSRSPNTLSKVQCELIDTHKEVPTGKVKKSAKPDGNIALADSPEAASALFDCELPIDVPPGRRVAIRFKGKVLERPHHRPVLKLTFTDHKEQIWTHLLSLPTDVLVR